MASVVNPRARALRMMLLIEVLAWAAIALAVALTSIARADDTGGRKERVSKKEGLRAFETVQQVLQHPRCQNCHIPGDSPLQFDNGIAHAQNVQRGADGKGMAGLHCTTCHAASNLPVSYGARTPPGAPNWHLPPEHQKMVFINLSASELCRVLKDPSSNGGKDMNALLEHVSHDKLVLWGWNPGEGRAPVSVPHDQFVSQFKRWMAADAPCPAAAK
jgi:hypothetical protein